MMELILGEGKKVLNSVEDLPSPPTPLPQGEGSVGMHAHRLPSIG